MPEHGRQRLLWNSNQSSRSLAACGRFVLWCGGRSGRGIGHCGVGFGYRRFNSRSGRIVRPRGVQAIRRSYLDQGRIPAFDYAGHARPNRPYHRVLRDYGRGPCGRSMASSSSDIVERSVLGRSEGFSPRRSGSAGGIRLRECPASDDGSRSDRDRVLLAYIENPRMADDLWNDHSRGAVREPRTLRRGACFADRAQAL